MQALENPTRKRVKSVIHTAVASCCVLYQAIGSAGYFYAYNACRGNILLNFGECEFNFGIGSRVPGTVSCTLRIQYENTVCFH